MRIENKTALITGGGGTIGSAIALRLAEEGTNIAVVGRTLESLEKTVAATKPTGVQCVALAADVSISSEVRGAVAAAIERFGGIDILVNVAGGPSGTGHGTCPFHEKEERIWNAVIDVNLKGTMICCQSVLPYMLDRQKGNIVNISSIDGMKGSPELGKSDYSAAKAGIIGFTKSLAKEVGPFGVRVNCVSPGAIASDKDKSNLSQETWDRIASEAALKRWGEASEVANVVFFLASEEASYVTGQNYVVGGGCYM
jgi:3-oxoacyl-[acyl-carrier protein] reductase